MSENLMRRKRRVNECSYTKRKTLVVGVCKVGVI